MSDRLDRMINDPKDSRARYRKKLEHLSIMMANEMAELAEFEAPGFCSSREFRSALTDTVWGSLDFQIVESNKQSIPFP